MSPTACSMPGLFFWTLGYDTIYALQDKDDDELIGVKSTARLFGAAARQWVLRFYAVAFTLILAAGFTEHTGWPFAFVMLLAGAHLLWQVKRLDIDDPANCLIVFRSNRETGALIALAFLLAVVGEPESIARRLPANAQRLSKRSARSDGRSAGNLSQKHRPSGFPEIAIAHEAVKRLAEGRRPVLLEDEMREPGQAIADGQPDQQPPGIAGDQHQRHADQPQHGAQEMQAPVVRAECSLR